MSSEIHRKVFRKKPTSFGERLAAFLRARHPLKTALLVAADTGLDAGRIEKWLALKARPDCEAVLILIETYGPSLLLTLAGAPAHWISAAALAEERAALEAQHAAVAARLNALRGT